MDVICVHVVFVQRITGVTTLLAEIGFENLECVPVIGQSSATSSARDFVTMQTMSVDLTRKTRGGRP